ncbi:peptide chain release factor H [Neisseria canis]|uniref:Peptide chain release factor 2 n=1 Tax=Neisseria canis TaxID=493 RepID=A0A448DBH6_9NEIS|nr:peptide chain release factor H [Neisseria canis]OSI12229.1 peptide chain release factor H [Neisseria canis]VEF03633.1 peptide chain release factor 2 [Neisseria canis]
MSISLHISTAQGPAECRIFARFALQKLLEEAQGCGITAEILEHTADKHGILSATVGLDGAAAEAFSKSWQGTLQWICGSPVRPKHPRKNWYIGIFRLPEPVETADGGKIVFQTCCSGGKGGQHVNKTESSVRATHTASGISVRVESERSQHANKKRARELLLQKIASLQAAQSEQHAAAKHSQLYQVERGNPIRVFEGVHFKER